MPFWEETSLRDKDFYDHRGFTDLLSLIIFIVKFVLTAYWMLFDVLFSWIRRRQKRTLILNRLFWHLLVVIVWKLRSVATKVSVVLMHIRVKIPIINRPRWQLFIAFLHYKYLVNGYILLFTKVFMYLKL